MSSKLGKSRGNVFAAYTGTGAATYTATAARPFVGLAITNDALLTNLVFVANGISITVKPGEVFDDDFDDFLSVRVTTNTAHRIVLRG